jgi:hypothetical protein
VITRPPSDVELQERAEGLLLGLVLARRWAAPDQERQPTEASLVEAVGQHILETGGLDEQGLLRRWTASWAPGPEAGRTQTDLVLEYSRSGRPWPSARETAARLTLRPDLDPPLLRTMPISIACLGRGATLRNWSRRVTAATHPDATSQLVGFAAARLAQNLLVFDLADSLARTAQAVREDAPESLISAFRPSGAGEEVPGGEDARGVLAAAVQSLVGAQRWDDAVTAAASRGIVGDQAVLLAGAFAGALLGVEDRSEELEEEVAAGQRRLAGALLGHSRDHVGDPLPRLSRISAATGAGR